MKADEKVQMILPGPPKAYSVDFPLKPAYYNQVPFILREESLEPKLEYFDFDRPQSSPLTNFIGCRKAINFALE